MRVILMNINYLMVALLWNLRGLECFLVDFNPFSTD